MKFFICCIAVLIFSCVLVQASSFDQSWDRLWEKINGNKEEVEDASFERISSQIEMNEIEGAETGYGRFTSSNQRIEITFNSGWERLIQKHWNQ